MDMSENWAICVGINRYDNIKPLAYARQDAEAIADFFRKAAGFKGVYSFAEDAPPITADFGQPLQSSPTFINLRRFLRVRFEERFLQPSDNIWFFFAGHGKRVREQDYLLPLDVDPGNVEETAIPVRYVVERLRRSGAENVILLLDACRNEGSRDGEGAGLEKLKGTVTLSSCSAAEFSYEIEELAHGAFTYGLLEALQLQGKSSCATVERLDNYLQTRVPEICRLHGKPVQTPCTFAEPLSKRNFILLPAAARAEDIEALKLDAFQAEANDDFLLAEQLWWRILAVDPADMDARAGIKRVGEDLRERGEKKQWWQSITRRQVLTIAGGGLVVAGGIGGWRVWEAIGGRRPKPFERQTEFVTVETVDSRGNPQPIARRKISYFVEPIGHNASMELSLLPGGDFPMGSAIGEFPNKVSERLRASPMRVRPFAISRTTVSQQQWLAVQDLHSETVEWPISSDPSSFKGDDLPVETVSWQDATEFCSRLSAITGRLYRLPTEAEWEYACRAGSTTAFHFGPTLTDTLANYCGTGGAVCGSSFTRDVSSLDYDGVKYPDGGYGDGPTGGFLGKTTPVRTYPPNAFGLFQMHGNVWEHCLDNWAPDLDRLPDDGGPFRSGGTDLRVLRGGAWSHNPALCRSASRDRMAETTSGWEGRVGLRVVCELEGD